MSVGGPYYLYFTGEDWSVDSDYSPGAIVLHNSQLYLATDYTYASSATPDLGGSWYLLTVVPGIPQTLNRTDWAVTASASDQFGPAANAIDGDSTTRWTSGESQADGMYFEIDLGSVQTFSRIVLDTSGSPGDIPVAYSVILSDDGDTWSPSVATGVGSTITAIPVGVQRSRYIRIVETGSGGWWSIHELNIYA